MGKIKPKKPKLKFNKNNLVFGSVFLVITISLLLLHAYIPGLASFLQIKLNDMGSIKCGAQSLGSLVHAICPSVGGEAGGVTTIGMPFVFIGALFVKVFSVSPEWGRFLSAFILFSIGLFGAYKLVQSMKVSRYVALAGATLYFLLPITFSMQQFGGTYWGFILLPSSIYLVWKILNLLPEAKTQIKLVLLGLWLLFSTTMIFMDGYSYFMYVLSTGIILFIWSWGKWKKQSVWLGYGFFLIANAVAYFSYKHLIPGAGNWTDSIDLFRAMGLDLVTLIKPASSLWWVKFLNLHFGGGSLWGDGSNSAYNYIGLSVLCMFVYGVIKNRKNISRLGLSLLIIGAISFILSLGPSLKINSTKSTAKSGPISHSSYIMPSSEAVVTLPTQPFYKLTPGLKSMRATYRWHILTMLVILTYASVGIQTLVNRKKTWLAIILLALMYIELLPNPINVMSRNINVNNKVGSFNQNVIVPLETYVKPGQKVIYYPNAVGNNDFLAKYITVMLGASTYNIGGDKAQAIAYPQLPTKVSDLLFTDDTQATLKENSGKNILAVLKDHTTDLIVVPKFDLRWDSYDWPPTSDSAATRAKTTIESAAKEADLNVQENNYFYIVSLK